MSQSESDILQLDDSQLETFDTEYMSDDRWAIIKAHIDRDFPDGDFRLLDVGGGNGVYADRVLADYPDCHVTVLDNSDLLLSKNEKNDRKSVLLASVDDILDVGETYDIITMNWLLHHLVGKNYATTRANQASALANVRKLLTPSGRISVFENIYTGWAIKSLPGWLVFQLTSLRFIAPLTRRLGANTAGIGVCFLSQAQWEQSMEAASLRVVDYVEPDDWIWELRTIDRVFLHLRHIRAAHFWIEPAGGASASPS